MTKRRAGKLRLEEELEVLRWHPWQWALAVVVLMGIVYGAIRFLEWAAK